MPACSGAPSVMGIHNTHTYLHPPTPSLNTWNTHTVCGAPELCSRWLVHVSTALGATGLQKTSVTPMKASACECVRVWTVLCSKGDSLPEWGSGNAARWRCHLSLNLVSPGVFIHTPPSLSLALDWHGYHPPIYHSPALSFTLLDCDTLSVNICLWTFCWWWGSDSRGMGNIWKKTLN